MLNGFRAYKFSDLGNCPQYSEQRHRIQGRLALQVSLDEMLGANPLCQSWFCITSALSTRAWSLSPSSLSLVFIGLALGVYTSVQHSHTCDLGFRLDWSLLGPLGVYILTRPTDKCFDGLLVYFEPRTFRDTISRSSSAQGISIHQWIVSTTVWVKGRYRDKYGWARRQARSHDFPYGKQVCSIHISHCRVEHAACHCLDDS